MHQNQLFNWTRLKLAGWYSIVMGLILCLFGLAIYQVMARAHWYGVDQELEVVSGTLHDALEPSLIQPGVISPAVRTLLPSLCLDSPNFETTDCSAQAATERHILGVVGQKGYYLRFLSLARQTVATIGYQPDFPTAQPQQSWQTLEDVKGTRYDQVTLSLKTRDGKLWGYMEVGRSRLGPG